MAFNCDFNAPMFVDFDNMDGEENADEFFDTHNEDGPLTLDQIPTEPDQEAPRVTRASVQKPSSQPLKPLNRTTPKLNTSTDHLRPKTSASSSLKTINKSANKTISKEQAALMVQRLCPAGSTLKKPKFVSLAEENKKFFNTPERFRRARKPRSSSADAHLRGAIRGRSPSPSVRRIIMPVTEAQSPKLLTRSRTRCNHTATEEKPKKQSSETRWEAIRKKMTATLKNVPIKATATSKMREEKAKGQTVVPAKQPMKAFRHQGIPIILHNQKQSEAAALEAAKAKRPKPVSANSVHIKLYEKDKEIRAKLESERQKEIERERQMALFKASDAKVLSKRPFMPRQCDKDPVRPRELNLHTDLRSEERQKFDQAIKEKEAEMEAAKQQEMERREREEMMDAQKQRELTVHKAAPVRNFAPITIQPSDRPVTDPSTPNFSMRRTRHLSS